MTPTATELYGDIWGRDALPLEDALTRSLNPRHADELFERMLERGLNAGSVLLDIGARDGRYAIELARRSGCRAIVADPVALHAEAARARIHDAGLEDRMSVLQTGIEQIPIDDGSISHVWCRDVLNHVELAPGLAECVRVLRPGGVMLVYQTFATPLLEPAEAQRLFSSMAIVPANMQPALFEDTAQAAGFTIALRDRIESEWRERWMEDGTRDQEGDLLKLARLRRRQADYVAQYGRSVYEATHAGLLWGIYQFLGKLCPTVYILEKPS